MCPLGFDSPGNAAPCSSLDCLANSAKCQPCLPGYYTRALGQTCEPAAPGSVVQVGSFVPEPCIPGSYSDGGSSTCTLCRAGTYNSFSGQTKTACTPCAVGYFSPSPGAFECTMCPNGWITPNVGTVSESVCMSPANNFILGFIALGFAVVGAVVYVIMGGFHFTAFVRRERVVMQQVQEYQAFVARLLKWQKDIARQLWSEDVDKRIAKILRHGDNYGVTDSAIVKHLIELFKSLLFLPFALVVISIVNLGFFALVLAEIFFKALIIYRQSHTFLVLLSYQSVLNTMVAKIESLTKNWPFLFVLDWLLKILLWIFDLLSSIKIDFSAVGVTCLGAGAPFQLLVNLFVLGVVIIVVESELQTFRGLCFQRTLERYSSALLSREYRRFLVKKLALSDKVRWFSIYVLRLVGLLCVQLIFWIVNFQNLLQFSMSLVEIRVFGKVNGLHEFSESCNQVSGYKNFDTLLAYSTSAVAYMLVFPVFYEVSKILCPIVPADEEEEEGNEPAAPTVLATRRQSLTPFVKSQLWQSSKASDSSSSETILGHLEALPISGWVRLPATLLSPDLFLAHITQGLVILLEANTSASVFDSDGGATNSGSSGNRLSELGASPRQTRSIMSVHEKRDKSRTAPERAFMHRAHVSAVRFFGAVTSTLMLMKKGSDEEKKWLQEKADSLMPSYYELVQIELYYLMGEISTFAPPIRRTDGSRYPVLGHFLTLLLILCPLGHFLTKFGRFTCRLVLSKYWTFLRVSVGYWSGYNTEAYDVQRKARELSDGQSSKDKGNITACLTVIVATRAILLQLIPEMTILSIIIITTSGCPLFVQPPLNDLIYKLFVWDCFADAERLELEANAKALKSPRWIVWLSGISIFLLESRAITFAVNVFKVFLSIYLLYRSPTKTLVGAIVAVFFPMSLAQSLRVVVLLGRAMNIKDFWDIGASASSTNKDIKELVKQGLGKEEIKAILAAKHDEAFKTELAGVQRRLSAFSNVPTGVELTDASGAWRRPSQCQPSVGAHADSELAHETRRGLETTIYTTNPFFSSPIGAAARSASLAFSQPPLLPLSPASGSHDSVIRNSTSTSRNSTSSNSRQSFSDASAAELDVYRASFAGCEPHHFGSSAEAAESRGSGNWASLSAENPMRARSFDVGLRSSGSAKPSIALPAAMAAHSSPPALSPHVPRPPRPPAPLSSLAFAPARLPLQPVETLSLRTSLTVPLSPVGLGARGSSTYQPPHFLSPPGTVGQQQLPVVMALAPPRPLASFPSPPLAPFPRSRDEPSAGAVARAGPVMLPPPPLPFSPK